MIGGNAANSNHFRTLPLEVTNDGKNTIVRFDRGGKFLRALFFPSILLVAAVVAEGAHIAYLQFVTFHPLPWNDEWYTLALFSQMEETSGSWRLLFTPHNEHRLALPRIASLLDVKLAGGTGAFTLLALDCLVLTTIALWGLLISGKWGNNRQPNLTAPHVLTLCIAGILLSGHQMSNFLWPFQISVFMVYLFAILAFASLGSAIQNASGRLLGRFGLFILLSCGFALCAALSLGNGIIVLPILFIIAFFNRHILSVGIAWIVGAIAVVVLGSYFHGLGSSFPLEVDAFSIIAVRFVWFFLHFLGGPWATAAPAAVGFAGLVTILLALYALLKHRPAADPRLYQVVAFGIIVLVLVSAAVVAVGRVQLGIEAAVESRYSTPVLILYSAILVSVWPRNRIEAATAEAQKLTFRAKLHEIGIALVVACILVYGVKSHLELPYNYEPLPRLKSDAEIGYVSNVQDPEHFKYVAPSIDKAWGVRRYLLRNNLSVFSTAISRSVDRRLAGIFTVGDRPCLGHLDQVESIVPGPDGGARISGWAWDSSNRRVPRGIVFVESGVVRGIGRFIVERPDVVAARPAVTELRNGFVGYVPRGVTKATAYILNPDETSVCLIPGELSVSPG